MSALRLADGIQGRAEEILRFPARSGGQVRVHPVVIHQVMDAVHAAAWQVIQQPGRLRVLVAGARPSFDPQVVTAGLRQALDMQQAAVPTIVIEHVAAIPRGRSGKALLIRPLPQRDHVTA